MPNSGIQSGPEHRGHVAALTSLRFFAALYVVLFHTAPLRIRSIPLARLFIEGGYIGVSFFFVLSGFVLGWTYLHRFAEKRVTSADFWRARFARIYPAYVFGLVVSAPYFIFRIAREQGGAAHVGGPFARAAAATLTLSQAWIPSYATIWNAPSWSLSVEAFFYALFPLLAVAVAALPRRRLPLAILAAWAAAAAAPLLYLAVRPDGAPYPLFDVDTPWINAVRYMPAPHLAEFVIGLLGARWVLDKPRLGESQKRDVTAPVLALTLVIISVVMFAAYPLYPFVHDGLLAPLFLMIIILLVEGRGALSNVLAWPALLLLGEASYSLYLLHLPVFAWLTVLGKRIRMVPDPNTSVVAWLGYVVLAVLVSVAALRTIEEPARRAIRERRFPWVRLVARQPVASSTPAAAVSSE